MELNPLLGLIKKKESEIESLKQELKKQTLTTAARKYLENQLEDAVTNLSKIDHFRGYKTI